MQQPNNSISKGGPLGVLLSLRRHIMKIPKTLLYHAFVYRFAHLSLPGLNLGSGNAIIENFCNIDASMFAKCDVIARVDKLKLSDNSVEVIYNSHVFEHFPREQAKEVLKEWYRVLKQAGTLYLCVPDIETLFRLYLGNLPRYESPEGRDIADTACTIAYGGQANKYDYHYYGYSFTTLAALLESAGFTNVERIDITALGLCGKVSAAQASINGVPISLNVKARK